MIRHGETDSRGSLFPDILKNLALIAGVVASAIAAVLFSLVLHRLGTLDSEMAQLRDQIRSIRLGAASKNADRMIRGMDKLGDLLRESGPADIDGLNQAVTEVQKQLQSVSSRLEDARNTSREFGLMRSQLEVISSRLDDLSDPLQEVAQSNELLQKLVTEELEMVDRGVAETRDQVQKSLAESVEKLMQEMTQAREQLERFTAENGEKLAHEVAQLQKLATEELGKLSQEMQEAHERLQRSAGEDVGNLAQGVTQLREQLQEFLADLRADEEEGEITFSTVAEAEALIQELGESPSAEKLAETVMAIDEMLVKPEEEQRFQEYKLSQVIRLRQAIKAEVSSLHKAALAEKATAAGVRLHAGAGRILAMYPMSDEPAVRDEATRLFADQTDVARRLELLSRQRYNRWAMERIEDAVDYYNKNASRWNPISDNADVIQPMVERLREIDPAALEPSVLGLYDYILENTKNSTKEKLKLEFVKRLTDPAFPRKKVGDF